MQGTELADIVAARLVDLGAHDNAYAGIYAPELALRQMPKGVTSQFLDDADQYHARYFDTAHTEWLLKTALMRLAPLPRAPVVLDIGSGSGNTVFALLDLLRGARIVATDASPQLLAIMNRALRETAAADRVTTLCLDLNARWFKPGTIDLAVGAAILHHLFDPPALVAEVFAAVKPGGSLVFFEPFEAGHAMVSTIYRTILAEAHVKGGLDPRLAVFFEAKMHEVALRRCAPKPAEEFADVDDKWLFTRPYLAAIAAKIGASRFETYSTIGLDAPFTAQVRADLRLGLDLPDAALPGWAWALIGDVEGSMSDDCKSEMIVEGGIIFTK
jgi:SAM-dependent methyltransferase